MTQIAFKWKKSLAFVLAAQLCNVPDSSCPRPIITAQSHWVLCVLFLHVKGSWNEKSRARVSGVKVFPLGGVKVMGLFREKPPICLSASQYLSVVTGVEMMGLSFMPLPSAEDGVVRGHWSGSADLPHPVLGSTSLLALLKW